MSDILSPFPETGFLKTSAGTQTPRSVGAAGALGAATARKEQATTPVVADLAAHQLALLDEWIEDRLDPKPTRGMALMLHFDWRIARCSSRIDRHPRSTIPDEVTGKDAF